MASQPAPEPQPTPEPRQAGEEEEDGEGSSIASDDELFLASAGSSATDGDDALSPWPSGGTAPEPERGEELDAERAELAAALAAQGCDPADIPHIVAHLAAAVEADRAAEQQQQQPRREPLLPSFDADGVAQGLREGRFQNVVVMCGAGISVAAGIPDFRTPGTGLYDNLQKYDLPNPQAIFEINYFKERPSAFYHLARELFPGTFAPTPTHYFIKLLHEKGLLLRCFTQNIDSLETLAGLPEDKMVAAHGNFDSAHCVETGKEVPTAEVKEAIMAGEEGWQAMRERHGGLVKPDIVFFGEALPPRFSEMLRQDMPKCDLLIVMGTSLAVQPFASLVGAVS